MEQALHRAQDVHQPAAPVGEFDAIVIQANPTSSCPTSPDWTSTKDMQADRAGRRARGQRHRRYGEGRRRLQQGPDPPRYRQGIAGPGHHVPDAAGRQRRRDRHDGDGHAHRQRKRRGEAELDSVQFLKRVREALGARGEDDRLVARAVLSILERGGFINK